MCDASLLGFSLLVVSVTSSVCSMYREQRALGMEFLLKWFKEIQFHQIYFILFCFRANKSRLYPTRSKLKIWRWEVFFFFCFAQWGNSSACCFPVFCAEFQVIWFSPAVSEVSGAATLTGGDEESAPARLGSRRIGFWRAYVRLIFLRQINPSALI